ncbi:NAD(P)/FAD-dependent oxidoreductase [Dyadobacter psychrotolerans]|uniref:NAD(P)/FAD-dependent oxidoreductase n=1 Tax=Dyadobacter psychrotolerans TaxID=2541721 RepID=A0A4R5DW46_9BACT|nr:NAD(P)/FAD-dependent oxidoreductase [Dyadobacter psychrotolerans]TDE15485.1 NAD(P)/FAD-dependent oxidoreductase [Dyadobacter psychrotolerans]
MKEEQKFDVIIIGGSYAGLAAAMSLGRAIRKVLIIDSGKPCNIQTPYSHNHLTQDGSTPAEIAAIAVKQVLAYPTVKLKQGFAVSVSGKNNKFEVFTETGEQYAAKKIIFTTGIRDLKPAIPGFSECWGISIIHCPYCHGYEYRDEPTGIFVNGEGAFEFARLIKNWTQKVTILTNGAATFEETTRQKIYEIGVEIIEKQVKTFDHKNGLLENIHFTDESAFALNVMYARVPFEQHSQIPLNLGCEFNELGYIKIDDFQKTNLPGIYAAGDNTSMMRSVSGAIAAGSKAGAMINLELIHEGL